MASGDAISQFVVERKSLLQYDGYRTSRFFLFGTCILVRIVLNFVTSAEDWGGSQLSVYVSEQEYTKIVDGFSHNLWES